MDFVTQFEHTLEQTINGGLLTEARQLLDAYPSTGHPYTIKLFSLINRVRQADSSKKERVLLFQTGNFILDYILEQFRTFFVSEGCKTMVFNPVDYTKSTQTLFSFAEKGIDAAYFFNNVGLLQTLNDGRNLWETLHIPCYDFLVDHPMYYADSLDYAPARTTLLCADLTHTDYVRRFYPRVEKAVFLPTGGCEVLSDSKTWDERDIDILFIGSYKRNLSCSESELDCRIKEYLRQHTDCTFEQAVEHCQSCDSKEMLKALIENHRFSETNLTSDYRKQLMELLLDAGLEIHVYGNGWEQTGLFSYPNFHLHSPVPFEEGINLMSRSKILLNHMAWFKHGSSERIFNAMAQGAVCVTDSSRYLDNILQDNVNCLIYSLDDIKLSKTDITNKIAALLSSADTWSEIAAKGTETATLHTWQKHLHYAIMDL